MSEQASVPVKTSNGMKEGVTRPARWDPIELLETLQSEMSRIWGEAWPLGLWATRRPLHRAIQPTTTWAPRMDVYQKDGQVVVEMELPGVRKEDVRVAVEDGDLVIRGERGSESEVKEEDYYRLERSAGTFYRRLPLGGEVAPERIKARFADGVLEITMPTPGQTRPAATTIPIT